MKLKASRLTNNEKIYSLGRSTQGEGSDQNDPEMSQWEDELKELGVARQGILDRLFDQCLNETLPICDDREMREHLTD